jgi:lipopolysaccharide export system permease protein
MYLLERYIFRRAFASFVLTLAALSATVWLSQALRQFDLVTARGQTLLTFLHLTLLLLPTLAMLIAPIALLIAVLYVLNIMNTDSELPIINAAGAPQGLIVRPVLWLGLLVTLLVAFISLYAAPLTQQRSRDLLTSINSDILTSVIQEGTFVTLAKGLTIHVKERGRDGSLEGIFVADEREPDQKATYLARRGTMIDNPLGSFLIMQDGVIQRENARDKSISIVEFQSYAFDMSSLTNVGGPATYSPTERTTAELFRPKPDDPYYKKYPERFRSELHDRFSAPLYALTFALIPLAFLGQARTTRQGRGAAITGAVLTAITVRGLGFLLVGMASSSPEWLPYLYALPVVTAVLALLVAFGILRPRLPTWMVSWVDAMLAPIGRLRRAPARR